MNVCMYGQATKRVEACILTHSIHSLSDNTHIMEKVAGAVNNMFRSAPMKRFSKPVSLPSGYKNPKIMRDHFKRTLAAEYETTVMALKFIARNTTLPQKARLQAQLQLSKLPYYARMNQIKNRCVDSGRSKGIIRDFKLCRYQFRTQALQGLLPGVKKGVW